MIKMLTLAAQFVMCVVSDVLVGGECCHCHFRGIATCSHRNGRPTVSTSPQKPSTSALVQKTSEDGASTVQGPFTKPEEEEVDSVAEVLAERKAKTSARTAIRRSSTWSAMKDDNDDFEDTEVHFLIPDM